MRILSFVASEFSVVSDCGCFRVAPLISACCWELSPQFHSVVMTQRCPDGARSPSVGFCVVSSLLKKQSRRSLHDKVFGITRKVLWPPGYITTKIGAWNPQLVRHFLGTISCFLSLFIVLFFARTSVKISYIGHISQSTLETQHYVDCGVNSTAAQSLFLVPRGPHL